MIRTLIIAISVLFLVTNVGGICAKEATYQDLITQAKDFDESIDFLQLRLLYSQSDDYRPTNTFSSARAAMFEALSNEQFEQALKEAHAILEENYLVLHAHYVCALAYQKMNNLKKYDLHMFILKGLVDSIIGEGDGMSPETAYKVINIEEEYFLIYSMGFTPQEQRSLNIAGHNYDEILLRDAEGNEGPIFFNVDTLFSYYNKLTEKIAQEQ